MNCTKYRNLMAAAVIGELSSSDRANLDRHLDMCASCRTELERMHLLTRALAPRPGDSLSEFERLRLENAVYRHLAHPTPAGSSWSRSLIRIAAAIILVGLGYFAHPLITRTTPPAPATTPPIPSSFALREVNLPAGSRFTAAGFKAIAYGRKAALEMLEADRSAPTPPK